MVHMCVFACVCITLGPPLALPVLPPVFPLTAPMKRASKSSCRRGSRECSSSIPTNTDKHVTLNTFTHRYSGFGFGRGVIMVTHPPGIFYETIKSLFSDHMPP